MKKPGGRQGTTTFDGAVDLGRRRLLGTAAALGGALALGGCASAMQPAMGGNGPMAGGRIVALDNGDLLNHEPYHMDHRAAFNGRGLAIVRATEPGVMTVTATVAGVGTSRLRLRVVRGKPEAVVKGLR